MLISIPDNDAEGYLHSLEIAHKHLPADARPEHYARIRILADQVEKAIVQQFPETILYAQKHSGNIVCTPLDKPLPQYDYGLAGTLVRTPGGIAQYLDHISHENTVLVIFDYETPPVEYPADQVFLI